MTDKINEQFSKLSSKQRFHMINKLFEKQNPISVNNKSVYKQDYQSLSEKNWLRTEAISSIITILQHKFQTQLDQMIKKEKYHLKNTQLKINKQVVKSSIDIEKYKQTSIESILKRYVKIVDPFVVTMILFTHQEFILQSLQGLGLFHQHTKYIVFPMNTQIDKGSHWFLTIFKNPRYMRLNQQNKVQKNQKSINSQLYLLNSIASKNNDSSFYMSNELSQQIIRLFNIFHKQQAQINKIQIKPIKNISHQSNSYDCGIFTIAFVQQLLFRIVLEKQITKILKLNLLKENNNKKQLQNTVGSITSNTQFILQKSSTYLRKYYRELLEQKIYQQNIKS